MNCRTLLHMHTRTCMCGALCDLLAALLPFQCSRLTAQILLRRLWRQEDLRFRIVGLPSAGTIGGPGRRRGPSQTPSLQIPPPLSPHPPLLIHPWGGLLMYLKGVDCPSCSASVVRGLVLPVCVSTELDSVPIAMGQRKRRAPRR